MGVDRTLPYRERDKGAREQTVKKRFFRRYLLGALVIGILSPTHHTLKVPCSCRPLKVRT